MKKKLTSAFNRFGFFMGSVTENWSQPMLFSIMLMFVCLLFRFSDNEVMLNNVGYLAFSFLMIIFVLPMIAMKLLQSKKLLIKAKRNVKKVFIILNVILLGGYILLYRTVVLIAIPIMITLYLFMLSFFNWFGNYRYPGLHVVKFEKFFEHFAHVVVIFIYAFSFGAIMLFYYTLFGDFGISIVVTFLVSAFLMGIFIINAAYEQYPRFISTEDVLFYKLDEPLPVCFV